MRKKIIFSATLIIIWAITASCVIITAPGEQKQMQGELAQLRQQIELLQAQDTLLRADMMYYTHPKTIMDRQYQYITGTGEFGK